MVAKEVLNTLLWQSRSDRDLAEAAAHLRAGGLVAFPTETVYGLGANARNGDAVQGIFTAKGRPQDNPLIVHIADVEELFGLVELTPGKTQVVVKLTKAFWPGPLSLVLPLREGADLAMNVTAGLSTVAVRLPDHDVARRLIRAAGVPLAAPSANRSGRPSPTTAQHVLDDMSGRIAGVVDGGATGWGLESTVVLVEDDLVRVLRPGAVDVAALQAALGEVVMVVGEREDEMMGSSKPERPKPTITERPAPVKPERPAPVKPERPAPTKPEPPSPTMPQNSWAAAKTDGGQAPQSPGVKYRHYAPQGRLKVYSGDPIQVQEHIIEQIQQLRNLERNRDRINVQSNDRSCDRSSRVTMGETTNSTFKIGVLTSDEQKAFYALADCVISCGKRVDMAAAAQGFYAALRQFDDANCTNIFCDWPTAWNQTDHPLLPALRNRLDKAADGDWEVCEVHSDKQL